MFKDRLKRLLGGGGPSQQGPELHACFVYLDKLRPGTAERLVTFVQTGEGRPILAELNANSQKIEKTLREHREAEFKRRNPDKPGYFYGQPTAEEFALTEAVLTSAGDPDRIVRLIEAGQAAGLLFYNSYGGYNVNSDLITPGAFHIFSLARSSTDKRMAGAQLASFADLLAAAEAFGTSHENLIASGWLVSYSGPRTGAYGLDWLTSAPVEIFQRAMKQLNAQQRETALELCLKHDVQPQGDMLPLLFELAGDGSAKVRDVARALIIASDDPRRMAMAVEGLGAGKATVRASMVQVLGEIGDEEALAALTARQGVEKTRAVQLLIEQFLSVEAPATDPDKPGYQALDGSWITPPEIVRFEDDGRAIFGAEDEAELKKRALVLFEDETERYRQAKNVGAQWARPPKLDESWKELLNAYNGKFGDIRGSAWAYRDWVNKAIKRSSPGRLLKVWTHEGGDSLSIMDYTPVGAWVADQLHDGVFDIRTLIETAEERLRARGGAVKSPAHHRNPRPDDVTISRWTLDALLTGRAYGVSDLPAQALWPLIADNLPRLAETLPPMI